MIKELPDHWKVVELGDASLKISLLNKIKQKDYLPAGKYPIIDQGQDLIGGYSNDENFLVPNEPPYIIFGDHTKVKKYINFKFVAGADGVKVLKTLSFYNPKFFYYLIHTVKIPNKGYARHFQYLEKKEIPLPPLPEQQKIVAKIEELFSELDKGKEQLETALQQLKVYRQAVLKWAFEGKLTNKVVKEGELPKGWKEIKLSNACIKIQDGSHFSPKVQYPDPGKDRFMYITAKNIRNNYMDLKKLSYVDKEFHQSIFTRCNPEFGDVLLTKDGVNTGEVTLNTLKEPFSLLSSVCIFKTNKEILEASFLKYLIQSPVGSKMIVNSMTGTAIKRIILRKIRDSKIKLPPLLDQLLIVQEIESRLSVCDKIEETIAISLKQAESLRQSILKKAFEGKLLKEEVPVLV